MIRSLSPRAGRRGLLRARDGVTAVEAAFILPVLLLLVLGVIELGRLAWTQAALDFAVQEAARCASVRPPACGSSSQVAGYAAQMVASLNIPASAFSVTTQACGTQVRAALPYTFIGYRIFATAPTLTAQACRI